MSLGQLPGKGPSFIHHFCYKFQLSLTTHPSEISVKESKIETASLLMTLKSIACTSRDRLVLALLPGELPNP